MHGRESKMRLMACKALVVDEISMISGEFLTQVRGGCCATNEAVVVRRTRLWLCQTRYPPCAVRATA